MIFVINYLKQVIFVAGNKLDLVPKNEEFSHQISQVIKIINKEFRRISYRNISQIWRRNYGSFLVKLGII